MNILINKPLAKSLFFDIDTMWIEFLDGRKLCVPLAYFPRLLKATPEDRKDYIISGGGSGLHWDNLDEDILVENLLFGIGDLTSKKNEGQIA